MTENTTDLELAEKLLKLANLEIDTALKARQFAYAPFQLAVSFISLGAALGGVIVGAISVLSRHGGGG